MLVGSSDLCNRSCRGIEESELKKHSNPHSIERSDIYVCFVRDYFELNSRRYLFEKVKFVKEYFNQLRNRVNEFEENLMRDLEKQVVRVGLSQKTPKKVIEQIEDVQKNIFGSLKCSDIYTINKTLDENQQTNTSLYNSLIKKMFLNVTESIKQVSEAFTNKEWLKKKEYKIIRGDNFTKKTEDFEQSDEDLNITLIKNIPTDNQRGHYNVEVKVVQFLHNIHSKDGVKNVLLLQDRNGDKIQCKTLRNPALEVGNTVRIENCFTRAYRGTPQIGMRRESTVSLIKDFDSKTKKEEKKFRYKKQEEQQKVFSPKATKDFPTFTKTKRQSKKEITEVPSDITHIGDIEPGEQNLKIYACISQFICQTGANIECVLGDETGIVNAFLPEEYDFLKEGQCVYLQNMEATVLNEHIALTFPDDSRVVVKKGPNKITKINYLVDISKAEWQQNEELSEEQDDE